MNRLKGMRTYLAGAMDRVVDGGVEWRDYIIPHLHERGVLIFNPANKPIDIGIEDTDHRQLLNQYKATDQFDKIRPEGGEIRRVDLRMVDLSDFLIVNYDIHAFPCGTVEEITTANREKKPILIRCAGGKAAAPTWLYFMLPHQHFFDTWEELLAYLDHIDTAEQVDDLKRWMFFDIERMILPLSNAKR